MKKLLLLLASLLSAAAAQAQWTQQTVPFSQFTYFPASLQAVSSEAAWAIGSNPSGLFTTGTTGTQEVGRTTNGGSIWQTTRVAGLTGQDALTSLSARHPDTAWVSTTGDVRSQVLRTTDGGASWQPLLVLLSATADRSLDYVYFFDARHGLALGNADQGPELVVYTTANAGATWQRTTGLPPLLTASSEYLTSVSRPAVVGPHIWVATTASRVFHSPDRGLTWTVVDILPNRAITPNGPRALAFQDAQQGLALFSTTDGFTNANPLYRTADGGASWQPVAAAGPLHGSNLVQVPGTATYLSVGVNLPGLPADAGSSVSRDAGATWLALEATTDHLLLDAAGPQAVWSSAYNFTTGLSRGVHKLGSTALAARPTQRASGGLQAFPNPSADGLFTLQLPAAAATAQVQVVDALGRPVAQQAWADAPRTTCPLNLASLPAGLYTVQVRTAAGLLVQRLRRQ